MAVEDGSALTRKAWDTLKDERDVLGLPHLEIVPLDQFLAGFAFPQMSLEDKTTIVDQAILMFENLYPHLPYKKKAFTFVRPVETLREIRAQLDPPAGVAPLTDADFHSRMILACNCVVDEHTLYGVPPPYRGAVAFLPFQIRAYRDNLELPGLVVTRIMKTQADGGSGHPFFVPGAEITHWNGTQAWVEVQNSRGRVPAGNPHTRNTRGAATATIRPLAYCQPPERMQETFYYMPPGTSEIRAIQIPWAVAIGLGESTGFPSSAFSVSETSRATRMMDRIMVHREDIQAQRRTEEALGLGLGSTPFLVSPSSSANRAPAPDLGRVSRIPSVFQFQYTGGLPSPGLPDPRNLQDEGRPNAKFGYLRIRTFGGPEIGTSAMVAEFRRILADVVNQHAPDGLILDIRGNPGGDVQAAERMLQMLTDNRITPVRFHLANTPAVQQALRLLRDESRDEGALTPEEDANLTDARVELQPWIDDVEDSAASDSVLTTGHPLTPEEDANIIGRVYRGPCVLLIDSLSYSAAEIFAAGFQDHQIGRVIGENPSTGGGGANVWTHDDTLRKLPATPDLVIKALPPGVTMMLAIRRCLRVGINDGGAVEDVGVSADLYYSPRSAEDLLDGFTGLINLACTLFGAAPVSVVNALNVSIRSDGSAVETDLKLLNVDALTFYINREKVFSCAVGPDSPRSFSIPVANRFVPENENPDPIILMIEGYARLPGDGGTKAALAATWGPLDVLPALWALAHSNSKNDG